MLQMESQLLENWNISKTIDDFLKLKRLQMESQLLENWNNPGIAGRQANIIRLQMESQLLENWNLKCLTHRLCSQYPVANGISATRELK